jgi:hypothetical protein
LVACAVFAVARALLRQRLEPMYAYAFPALRIQTFFPWYAIWALPYALLEKRRLAHFLCLLPLTAFLMETGVAKSAQSTLYACICALIAIAIPRDLRLRRSTALSEDRT